MMTDFLLNHIEKILGVIGSIFGYFIGVFHERRTERKNRINNLFQEIDSAYQTIIDNIQKTPPNVSSTRYMVHRVETKIKELCELNKLNASDIIHYHAQLSVYATDEECINHEKISEIASKVMEKLS